MVRNQTRGQDQGGGAQFQLPRCIGLTDREHKVPGGACYAQQAAAGQQADARLGGHGLGHGVQGRPGRLPGLDQGGQMPGRAAKHRPGVDKQDLASGRRQV